MDLNCRDIESEKDTDSVGFDVMQKDFTHEYHAAAYLGQLIDSGKKSTYITHMDANGSHSQLAAVCSDYSLSLFDWTTLKSLGSLRGHTDKVTGVRFMPGSDSILVSSSLDGSLKQWDARTGTMALEHSDNTLEKRKPLTCVDANAAGRFLCAGTEVVDQDAYLVFWDVRRPEPLGGYWESHTDELSTVRFHPSDDGALATGSTDGYVNVFDVTQTSEDDALQSTLNTESSVNSVTWYERDGNRHLAVILDTEELQLWDLQESERTAQFGRREVAQALRRTMSEVCYVESCHQSSDGEVLAVAGATTKEGRGCLRLLRVSDNQLRPHALLDDSEVSQQLVRASVFSPQSGELITGGEGGMLTLWRPGARPSSSQRRDAKAPSHKQRDRHKQRPY